MTRDTREDIGYFGLFLAIIALYFFLIWFDLGGGDIYITHLWTDGRIVE